MPTSEDRQGFVYFLQPEGGGNIKIGWAYDPELRLSQLQCGSPLRLRICRTHPGSISDEKGLHKIFAELREHGEWFRAHPALARVADAIPDPDIPDSVLTPNLKPPDGYMWRLRPDGPAISEDFAPFDPRERRKRYEERWPLYGGDLPLTAIPDDMAPENEWRQSSSEAA